MLDQVEMQCSKLSEDGLRLSDPVMIKIKDILIIDNYKFKNEMRFRVRTSTGEYIFSMRGPLSALGDMLRLFGFWRADNSRLINMNAIDKVKVSLFAAEVIFKETETRGAIAVSRVRVLKKLFPEIPIIKVL